MTKPFLSAFLYDATYDRVGDLQNRVLKIGKMTGGKGIKSLWEKYSGYGQCPIITFHLIPFQTIALLISEGCTYYVWVYAITKHYRPNQKFRSQKWTNNYEKS